MLRNRTVQNAGWLMCGRIVHMLLSFLMGLLTARYLGPSHYGLIQYVAAYATFLTPLCTLGIHSVIVKNLIDHPVEEGKTLGTALVLRLFSSFCSLCVIIAVVSIVDRSQPVVLMVAALHCTSLVFQAFDSFNDWFQSKLLSKYQSIASMAAYALASVYRLYMLMEGKSVEWFAIATSIDYGIAAALLYLFYKRRHGPKLCFSIAKAKELLRVSRSYILSGLMIAVSGAADRLMLKHMLSDNAVGYYSLAVSISTMWTFVLSSVIDSVKPSIMRYHNENRVMYEKANRSLYAIVLYGSLLASLLISLVAPLFVRLLYGQQYLPAVEPLRIVVWYTAFSYLGVARDIWIVCERKQQYLKYLYMGSALLNVGLNAALIPLLGVNGAAAAALLTQISTIFVFPLFIKAFRSNMQLMIDAIRLKNLIWPQRSV